MLKTTTKSRYQLEDQLADKQDVKGLKMACHDLQYHRKNTLPHAYKVAKKFHIMLDSMQKALNVSPSPYVHSAVISLSDLAWLYKNYVIPANKNSVKYEDINLKLSRMLHQSISTTMNSPKFKRLLQEDPHSKALGEYRSPITSNVDEVKSGLVSNIDFNLDTKTTSKGVKSEALQCARHNIAVCQRELKVIPSILKGNPYHVTADTVMVLGYYSDDDGRPQSAKEAEDDPNQFSASAWVDKTQKQTRFVKRGMDFQHEYNVQFRPALDNQLKKPIKNYLSHLDD